VVKSILRKSARDIDLVKDEVAVLQTLRDHVSIRRSDIPTNTYICPWFAPTFKRVRTLSMHELCYGFFFFVFLVSERLVVRADDKYVPIRLLRLLAKGISSASSYGAVIILDSTSFPHAQRLT
jgi:hypothetical protein